MLKHGGLFMNLPKIQIIFSRCARATQCNTFPVTNTLFSAHSGLSASAVSQVMLKSFVCAIALFTLAVARPVHAQEPAASPSIRLLATDCDIDSSGQALLAEIETWLSIEFDLPPVGERPCLKIVSTAKIAALRFKGLLSNPEPGMVANNHGTSSAQGDTIAVYHDVTQTIYLPEGWTGSSPAERSVLVHEMVHHFQNVLGLKHECPQEREKLAYIAQDRWLGLFGHSLAGDFALDPFSLLVKTRCFF